jgi:hypothetical protein
MIPTTLVTLKEYVDSRLAALDKAVIVAAALMDKRLDGMNEFRDALRDSQSQNFTRKEHDIYREGVERDLRSLREFKATIDAKASQSSMNIAMVLSVLAFLVGVMDIILRMVVK